MPKLSKKSKHIKKGEDYKDRLASKLDRKKKKHK